MRSIYPSSFLLPQTGTPLTPWACIACDQYTSDPSYWQAVDTLCQGELSTYHLILPESKLEQGEQVVDGIHSTMQAYLPQLQKTPNGYILIARTTPSGTRLGLVCVVDLDAYDFNPASALPIRATEETIAERIAPRVAIRKGAPMELSHVLLLMDDAQRTVLEPLYAKRNTLKKCYDFPLMMKGGHLTGYLVSDPTDLSTIDGALETLRTKTGKSNAMIFAVGDGNHSLAAAKACWATLKTTLTPEQAQLHPARYAMVELENLYDDALGFEPIHRILFGVDVPHFRQAMQQAGISPSPNEGECTFLTQEGQWQVTVQTQGNDLPVEEIQRFLDDYVAKNPQVKLDYIHGDDALRQLANNKNTVGFLLPALPKESFFRLIEEKGTLPRKTFSMGHADEKRYYMECRQL